jgi:hypothetical protein
MKKTIFLAVLAIVLASCTNFQETIDFKLIGDGDISLTIDNDGEVTKSIVKQGDFKAEKGSMLTVTAFSLDSLDITLEAYVGDKLIRRTTGSKHSRAVMTITNYNN